MTNWIKGAAGGLLALAVCACTPGYMKAADLEKQEQGPQHCAARCRELGMEMGALVLVSNSLPGCVCQVTGAKAEPGKEGAAAATTSYAVVLAAAAAAHQQQMQQHQVQYSAPGHH